MGRSKQGRPIKRRRVVLEADDSVVAEEQTTFAEQQQQQGEEELAKAIELLRKTPQDRVEAAAAEATRLDLSRKDRWVHLKLPKTSSIPLTTMSAVVFDDEDTMPISRAIDDDDSATIPVEGTTIDSTTFVSHVPPWLGGLGFARLSREDFVAFRKLHQAIKDRINNTNKHAQKKNGSTSTSSKLGWASWSGSVNDPRKRAFGFLPGTWGYDPETRNNRLDITMPETYVAEDTKTDERKRNKREMVVLDESDVPDGVREAIDNICRVFRECLLSKNERCDATPNAHDNDSGYRHRLAQFLRYENLVAAQPNLHSGRALLPVHLDDPLKDGFGVVIVTIGVEGSGTILFRDAKGVKNGVTMNLDEGEVYMLADRARDACAHGVLADARKEDCTSDGIPFSKRESLNLRFGLHDAMLPPSIVNGTNDAASSSLPVIPACNVFRHWDE
ncbi:unnamed protein product [Pseudo-nitzschia multistriata]|uniref:Uncharacterized protein n=1 Tax=Pseudo-nitzschia multistriata TaxID=183589 RepID=A0A448ZAQ3_9STRA|nr:unnamed protein product [Pseudo-nitzschia multistriata]